MYSLYQYFVELYTPVNIGFVYIYVNSILSFISHFPLILSLFFIIIWLCRKQTSQSDIYQKKSNFTFNIPITKSLKLILLYTMIKKMHDKVMSKSILIIFQCSAFKLYSTVRYFTCKNTFCILSICLLLHFQMC